MRAGPGAQGPFLGVRVALDLPPEAVACPEHSPLSRGGGGEGGPWRPGPFLGVRVALGLPPEAVACLEHSPLRCRGGGVQGHFTSRVV